MLKQGIYLAPSAFEAGFVSLAHDDEILAKTALAIENSLALAVRAEESISLADL